MTVQNGDLVLLKIGDGGSPEEIFTAIGGLRSTEFFLENHSVESSNLSSGSWRELLEGAGIRRLGLSGAGFFTDSAAEATLRGRALAGSIRNYEMTFSNGDKISGPFQITSYRRGGDFGAAETYALSLASAGAVTFTAG